MSQSMASQLAYAQKNNTTSGGQLNNVGSCGALLVKEGIERSQRPDELSRKASHFGRSVRNEPYQLVRAIVAHWSATVMTPLRKINKPRNDLHCLKANETLI